MNMEFEDRFRQARRQTYDCLLFDLDDTLYPVGAGLAAAVLQNIKDYMVEKLGIDKSGDLCNLLYKNYGTTMAGLTLEKSASLEDESNPYISKSTRLPRKRFYRARAHSNPLSDSHFPVPVSPSHVDYSLHFPQVLPPSDSLIGSKKIEFADIGCGFGGLLISLATLFPETLMIGMELRDKVTEYVKERILALRKAYPGQYQNVSVARTNSMKYIPNYFEKAQLSKMFFLFPDPHFKEKNHRRRVISPYLLDEYAYALRVGGIIYTITDVEELGEWMKSCLENHPMFEALTEKELEADPVIKLLSSATEEGQKVSRNGGLTFQAVYRRITPQV